MKCNPQTCHRSILNTSRVLRRNIPDIEGSCGDCRKFMRGNRDWWFNGDLPIKAVQKVKIRNESL